MQTNYLIVSEQENYLDAARLIVDEAKRTKKICKIVFIEKMMIDSNSATILPKGGCVYFLTNHYLVSIFAAVLRMQDFQIINGDFVSREKSKLYVQARLKNKGISVPQFRFSPEQKICYKKFYCKSFSHATFVKYLKNNRDFFSFRQLFSDKDFHYFESALSEKKFKEYKYYSILGKFIPPKAAFKTAAIIKDIAKIANLLMLEAFSVDIIVDERTSKYWVIDVNPASAFFKSTAARREFVKKLLI